MNKYVGFCMLLLSSIQCYGMKQLEKNGNKFHKTCTEKNEEAQQQNKKTNHTLHKYSFGLLGNSSSQPELTHDQQKEKNKKHEKNIRDLEQQEKITSGVEEFERASFGNATTPEKIRDLERQDKATTDAAKLKQKTVGLTAQEKKIRDLDEREAQAQARVDDFKRGIYVPDNNRNNTNERNSAEQSSSPVRSTISSRPYSSYSSQSSSAHTTTYVTPSTSKPTRKAFFKKNIHYSSVFRSFLGFVGSSITLSIGLRNLLSKHCCNKNTGMAQTLIGAAGVSAMGYNLYRTLINSNRS